MAEGAAQSGGGRVGALLALCRVSNLPTVWMNVLTGALLCGAPVTPIGLIAVLLSLSCFYCHGMALNDVCDVEHDRAHQPFRPIPAGRIGLAEARRVSNWLLLAGLALLLLAPHPSALLPALLLAGLIQLYDRLHKRHASSVFLMAGCRTLVFVTSGWAISGEIAQAVMLGGGLSFLYTLAVSLVARHESTRGRAYSFPLIPRMIAGMSIADGLLLAVLSSPLWLAVGALFALLTRLGQRFVRGD